MRTEARVLKTDKVTPVIVRHPFSVKTAKKHHASPIHAKILEFAKLSEALMNARVLKNSLVKIVRLLVLAKTEEPAEIMNHAAVRLDFLEKTVRIHPAQTSIAVTEIALSKGRTTSSTVIRTMLVSIANTRNLVYQTLVKMEEIFLKVDLKLAAFDGSAADSITEMQLLEDQLEKMVLEDELEEIVDAENAQEEVEEETKNK